MVKKYAIFIIMIFALSGTAQEIISSAPQDSIPKFNYLLTEVGLSYPKSLNDQIGYFNLFMNIGVKIPINQKYFASGLMQLRYNQGEIPDFAINGLLRINTNLSAKYSLSTGAGYVFKSSEYGTLPGPLLEINLNKTDKYGLHIKYEQLKDKRNKQRITPDENRVSIGLHLCHTKARKTVIGTAIVVAAVGLIIAIIAPPYS